MRKRFYILFVTRDAEGQLRKIPIPMHYVYVFLAGALIGMFTITGMAGSYGRMLMKVARFNQVRAERENLKAQYTQLEQQSKEKDIQVASLGSLAGEVSTLYGLKPEAKVPPSAVEVKPEQVTASMEQLSALRASALTGVATYGLATTSRKPLTLADWVRASEAPTLWPVEGRLTSSFGERIDPFNGEGAFHCGVDISSTYGHAVVAPADGTVEFADLMNGYGRLIEVNHGNGVSTRFGHLSGFAVVPGQMVHRGQIIGYVGTSGRTTSPHLHYEVRIHETPVNPYKYLRTTLARSAQFATGD